MNFAYNYIENYNKLSEILIDDALFQKTKQDKEHHVQVEQINEDDKTTSLFYFEEDKKAFCKIEHSKKGIYFFKAKDGLLHTKAIFTERSHI